MASAYKIVPRHFYLFDKEVDSKAELERYFNDVYALFLKKITAYVLNGNVNKEEEDQLKKMLDEMIAVRQSLHL